MAMANRDSIVKDSKKNASRNHEHKAFQISAVLFAGVGVRRPPWQWQTETASSKTPKKTQEKQ